MDDVKVEVAGRMLTIKPGAPELALLCRAIFRASFSDDEDEAVVNQKYNEWPEAQAKAIRAAQFVLRAMGGNGAVVRALTRPNPDARGSTGLVEALREARGQLEYLDGRYPTGTTPATVARIDAALREATQ